MKAIIHGVIGGLIGTVLFFIIGMFFESETRDGQYKTQYNNTTKKYEEVYVQDAGIEGNTTAYFAMAGFVLGVIGGVVNALDKGKKIATNTNQEVNSQEPKKKTPPKIP
ncbi:MAG: hypothetical protein SFU27_11795 [Thermonemataceae bacterium]|nr:hypothetical protein [Thermonemataceae bacterium]